MFYAYEKEEKLQGHVIARKLTEVCSHVSAAVVAEYAILQTSSTLFSYRFGSINGFVEAGLIFVNMAADSFWLLKAFEEAIPEHIEILAVAGATNRKIVQISEDSPPYSFLVIVDTPDVEELEELMRELWVRGCQS